MNGVCCALTPHIYTGLTGSKITGNKHNIWTVAKISKTLKEKQSSYNYWKCATQKKGTDAPLSVPFVALIMKSTRINHLWAVYYCLPMAAVSTHIRDSWYEVRKFDSGNTICMWVTVQPKQVIWLALCVLRIVQPKLITCWLLSSIDNIKYKYPWLLSCSAKSWQRDHNLQVGNSTSLFVNSSYRLTQQ